METIRDLAGSKRFLVVTVAVVVLAAFVLAGRMTVDEFETRFTWLAGLLATLYGLENVAAAHGTGFPDPAPPSQVTAIGHTIGNGRALPVAPYSPVEAPPAEVAVAVAVAPPAAPPPLPSVPRPTAPEAPKRREP